MTYEIYIYIDLEGKVGQSEDPPTAIDSASVLDGQLTVLRVSWIGGVQFCEEYDPSDDNNWSEAVEADTDCDESGDGVYHFIP